MRAKAALVVAMVVGSFALGSPVAADPAKTSATLTLRYHLTASVKVSAEVPSDQFLPPRWCEQFRGVRIQRRTAGDWITVERGMTNQRGRFRAEIEDRPGRYRAVVARAKDCTAAISNIEKHRH